MFGRESAYPLDIYKDQKISTELDRETMYILLTRIPCDDGTRQIYFDYVNIFAATGIKLALPASQSHIH